MIDLDMSNKIISLKREEECGIESEGPKDMIRVVGERRTTADVRVFSAVDFSVGRH